MRDRIEAIKAMLQDNPRDVFLLYSLGMEEVACGRFDRAAEAFGECMAADAAYLPARVERGKALRAAGKTDEAREAFEAAMALAAEQNDTHAVDAIRQHIEGLGG